MMALFPACSAACADCALHPARSHKKKRMQQIKKLMQRGLLDPEQEDPFSLFVASTNIRYCYYSDTHKVLGNTFGMCVLQVKHRPALIKFSLASGCQPSGRCVSGMRGSYPSALVSVVPIGDRIQVWGANGCLNQDVSLLVCARCFVEA